MTLPPFPAHLALSDVDYFNLLAGVSLLERNIVLSREGQPIRAESHRSAAVFHLRRVAEAMGFTITPVMTVVEPVRTAEAFPDAYVASQVENAARHYTAPGPHNLAAAIHDGTGVYFDGGL